jgi:uncharacterized protein YukE
MADVYNTHIQIPETLEGAGPFMQGISEVVVGELATLKGKLATLPETWSGSTHTYFEDQYTAWHVASDGLFGPEGVMGMIAHALNVNYDNYTEAELASGHTWKQN